MKSFLSNVAKDLYRRCGGDLSHTVVVFPGKRASLFFNQELARISKGEPLFAPTYVTLDELFEQLSDLKLDDPIRLVCLLHQIYCEKTKRNEPIDYFYCWGQKMLADFDDIDKNHVEAKALFCNLDSLKQMSSSEDYLSREQVEVLEHFFGKIVDDSELKKNFIRIWEVIGDIYSAFRSELMQQGIAYSGMLYRNAIETFVPEKITYERYAFVGFNVLSTVEEELFHLIKNTGKALFYWDYDVYYRDASFHEAGSFIRNNLKKFGNALENLPPIETDHPFDNLRSIQKITIVSAPSDNAQASFVHDWIQENITLPEQETAVVLADEKLLLPVLHALPEETIKDVNVTMGLPLTQTSVYHFLTELIAKTSDIEDNCEWLTHISKEIDRYGLLLKKRETRLQDEEEALYRAHLAVTSLRRIVSEGILVAGRRLLLSLLMQILKGTSIPFHGEPACGLQIMGVLETRNLDFRHILLLSANEGVLPRTPSEVSFIPYNLRKAFGLTTIERQTAVYAYYFYRLLQRAEKVTLVYNNGTDGMIQAAPSRFVAQLAVEWKGAMEYYSMEVPSSPYYNIKPISIPTDNENRNRIIKRFSPRADGKQQILSPTALQDYMACPFKFWLKYVEGLKTDDENTEDVSPAQFGTLFHYSAQEAYEKLTENGSTVRRSDLESMAADKVTIRRIVADAFRKKYFKFDEKQTISDTDLHFDGIHLINFAALERYLRKMLLADALHAPFQYHKSELRVAAEVTTGNVRLTLGGYIDRIDQRGDVLRIVDYKTGGNEVGINDINELFNMPGKKQKKQKVFQAFYYAWVLCQENLSSNGFRLPSDVAVSPALYYIKNANRTNYDPTLLYKGNPLTDFARQAYDDFDRELRRLLNRIFNQEEPFTQAENDEACKYCDFCYICHRQKKSYL